MGLILILMRKKLKVIRIVLAALAGGVASVAQMVIGCCFKPFDLIWTVLMGNFMLFILIGRMSLIELEKGIVYFFTLSFAFTKLYGWGRNLLGGVGLSAIFTVFFMGCIVKSMVRGQKYDKPETVYNVEIIEQGEQIELKALYDTGNVLREPFSGKPVSIVERESLKNIELLKKPEKYKIIPFRSIGEEHGILKGMEVDEVIIEKKDTRIVLHRQIIAFYDGRLSQDGSFQMILNQEVF